MGYRTRAACWLFALSIPGVLTSALPVPARATPPRREDLLRKQPYLLFGGDPTQLQVLWQLNATAPATIVWGRDSTYSLGRVPTSEYGDDHQHSFVIPDLVPGAHYEYKVTVGGDTLPGSFTAASDSSSDAVRFFAYGDSRTNVGIHDEVAGGMLAAMAADSNRQSFVLSVGDLVYDGDSESSWMDEFFNPAAPNVLRLISSLPFQSARGNHERAAVLFAKYFAYPFVEERYWSFEYGPAHFLLMDQYTSYEAGSAQLAWIEGDLAATTKPWKFICLHEPGWSSGGHENNLSVQTLIQPLCLQYGVSIVFGGHNHYYARAEVNGVRHITTGGGGAPLYQPADGYPHVVVAASAHHYCEVDIQGETLEFRAITTDGTILDSFTMSVPSGVDEISDARISPGAFPNPFHAETMIRWQPGRGSGGPLLIQDATGRLVQSFSPSGTGLQTARWDGIDDHGRSVASGVYFLRVVGAPTGNGAGTVLLVR